MRNTFFAAFLLVLVSSQVWADANDGDLFGFRLGDRYTEKDTKSQDDGRVVLVATKNPVKPDAIDTVYVLVTPISRSIGKIVGESWFESGEDAIVAYERYRTILRQKYPDWESEERSDVHYQGTAMNSNNLSLSVQVSGPHRDNATAPHTKSFQLVLALAWEPGTPPALDFEAQANEETRRVAIDGISEDEVRGL